MEMKSQEPGGSTGECAQERLMMRQMRVPLFRTHGSAAYMNDLLLSMLPRCVLLSVYPAEKYD